MKTNQFVQTKKAVIYCRVSTKEQVDEGNSLVSQERICKEYALKYSYEIEHIFIEQGESAKTANRTELQKLLTFCSIKKNNVSYIIIYKIDRLSRNTDDYSQLRLLFKKYGVEIKSVSEYFENNSTGRFMENMMANVAQFDNDVRTERSVNGMKDALREGRYIWPAPIGYLNVKEGGKSTIAHGPIATLVQETFQEVAKNIASTEEIRLMMINRGLVQPNGKPLGKSYFYEMLRNELYTGKVEKFGETFNGLFKPIVSIELFNRVQLILKKRSRKNLTYMTENPNFPLRRFFIHPQGKKLTGSWSKGRSKKYPHYRYHEPKLNFSKDRVEKLFCLFLNKHRLFENQIELLKTKVRSSYQRKEKSNGSELIALEKSRQELKLKETGLIDKNLKGVISDLILQEQLSAIGNNIIQLDLRIAGLQKQNYRSIEQMLDFTKNYIQFPFEAWYESPFIVQLQLQWFYFPQGILFDGIDCRTTEMCCIFKLKQLFSDCESGVESFSLRSTNHKPKLKLNSSLLTNEFLDELHSDLSKLEGIIKGEEDEDVNINFKKPQN